MSKISNLRLALVQFGFRLLYNELAFIYDIVSQIVSLGAWRCWQRTALSHLNIPTSAKVLELAFGTGNLQVDLIERGYIPVGFDLSPYMGHITRKKLQKLGYSPCLVRGTVQHLPFPAQIFEAIICTFPTNFIFESSTMREVHRILVSQGQYIIVLNGMLNSDNFIENSIEWLYKITGQRESENYSLSDIFETYGFKISIALETCPHSKALVIVATKKG